jgi:hypothetical protein
VPFAVIPTVSDQVLRFGVGPTAVTDRLAAESVFSVNAAAADALETAAGTPVAFTVSALRMADLGIAKVWAKTGAKPTALVLNSADYPRLSDKAAVGPGDTVGAEGARFNGIPLVAKAIGGDDPADTHHLPPPVVPYATTMLEAPDGLRIGYVESVEAIGVTIAADCVEAVIEAAPLLEALGHHLEPGRRRGCSTRSSRRTICDPPAGNSSTCWTGSRPRSAGP